MSEMWEETSEDKMTYLNALKMYLNKHSSTSAEFIRIPNYASSIVVLFYLHSTSVMIPDSISLMG